MDFKALLGKGRVIPAVRHVEDLAEVFNLSNISVVFLLGGDIDDLEKAVKFSERFPDKCLLAHLDLLNGIGKDEAGIRYLHKMGLRGIVSVKWQLLQYAKKQNMLTVQRLFMIDSDALKSGLKVIKKVQPDAVEILPAYAPKFAIDELKKATDVCLLGGGLLRTGEDVQFALGNGLTAVTASRRNLWNLPI